MDTEPPVPSQPDTPLRTADELFARPQCVHIVSMNNPGQNIHLERTNEGFRLTFGSLAPHLGMFQFGSLDELYDAAVGVLKRINWRATIWQDISDFPPFSYGVEYRLLGGPIELGIIPDSDMSTPHGPHAVYGPAEIVASAINMYILTPAAEWLVVEYPAYTMRGRGGRAILRSTHSLLDRLRLKAENYRLRHDKQIWTVVRPGVTIVYGKPPIDWQTMRQLFAAERTEMSGGHD